MVPQQVRRSRRMSGVADIRSVVRCLGIRTRSDQSATSGAFLSAVHVRPESHKVVRPGGSQRGSQATVWPTGSPGVDRPFVARRRRVHYALRHAAIQDHYGR